MRLLTVGVHELGVNEPVQSRSGGSKGKLGWEGVALLDGSARGHTGKGCGKNGGHGELHLE